VAKPKLRENTFVFEFPDCNKLPSPVLPFDGVSFAYSGKKVGGALFTRVFLPAHPCVPVHIDVILHPRSPPRIVPVRVDLLLFLFLIVHPL
jgi:hypothetical protein